MSRLASRTTKGLILSSALAAGLLLGPLSSLSAHAALTYCRTDPVVLLSNGKTVQMEADISDTGSDVQHVDYVLRAPVGISVVSVVYSGDLPAGQESFEFFADARPGNYATATSVTTGLPHVSVTVTTSVTGAATDMEEGESGHPVRCHLRSL